MKTNEEVFEEGLAAGTLMDMGCGSVAILEHGIPIAFIGMDNLADIYYTFHPEIAK